MKTDIEAIVANPIEVAKLKEILLRDGYFVLRSAYDRDFCIKFREHLFRIVQSQIPNYQPIARGSPNFYRINFEDARSYVGGHFRQVSLFKWNQDPFSVFRTFRSAFQLKNLLSGHESESYLDLDTDPDFVARFSFQFYDSGAGYMNKHSDPVGPHQLAIPSIVLSRRGVDFKSGGLSLEKDGRSIDVESELDVGDVLFFNGAVPHEVSMIDENDEFDPIGKSGRWIGVLAVNKVAGSTSIGNSTDFGKK